MDSLWLPLWCHWPSALPSVTLIQSLLASLIEGHNFDMLNNCYLSYFYVILLLIVLNESWLLESSTSLQSSQEWLLHFPTQPLPLAYRRSNILIVPHCYFLTTHSPSLCLNSCHQTIVHIISPYGRCIMEWNSIPISLRTLTQKRDL